MSDLYLRFDSVFFEKTRLSMMTLLYREGAVSFNRLKALIGGSDGAIYTHVRKLVEAGYVASRKRIVGDSPQTVYSLARAGTRLFKEYLVFLEHLVEVNSQGAGGKSQKRGDGRPQETRTPEPGGASMEEKL